MILDNKMTGGGSPSADNRATLDDLFRRAAIRHPDAVALEDAPNRSSFTDDAPRTLTYAQADRVIWAIAARLRSLGLQTDAVIALQLPNTVDCVLTILGILRAGMIAAPLPMLWRQDEMSEALVGIGVKMLITCGRIGEHQACDTAMQAASRLFSVRHVGAFGAEISDGVIRLDDVFADTSPDTGVVVRNGNPADHVAVITFNDAPDGPVAVARNHQQLIAGGLAVFLESGLESEAAILTATPMSSFAGIACAMLPWLLSSGRLVLHQPFDAATFVAQHDALERSAVVVPGALAEPWLAAPQDRAATPTVTIALWRSPERITAERATSNGGRVIDVTAFGELGLIATPRTPQRNPRAIPLGVIAAPSGSAAAIPAIETARTLAGTLALRGAMVPAAPFPPTSDNALAGADGLVDTGYPCRIDRANGSLTVTGPQPGMTGVGGYRFSQRRLDTLAATLPGGTIIALPDPLTGQRLAASAASPAAAQPHENRRNPLIAGAFRQRATPKLA
jgi:hypothetical protein